MRAANSGTLAPRSGERVASIADASRVSGSRGKAE